MEHWAPQDPSYKLFLKFFWLGMTIRGAWVSSFTGKAGEGELWRSAIVIAVAVAYFVSLPKWLFEAVIYLQFLVSNFFFVLEMWFKFLVLASGVSSA